MKIAIGSEKAGFFLKNAVKNDLEKKGHIVIDVGPETGNELTSYVDTAQKVSQKILSGDAEKGVLICGTGMGMALAANKHKGIYAAVVESVYTAKLSRLINDSNIVCLGAFIVAEKMAYEIVDTFIETGYLTNFEKWRVEFLSSQKKAMSEVEEKSFK